MSSVQRQNKHHPLYPRPVTDTAEIQPDPDTWTWLTALAARHHNGSIADATIAVLRAARLAEQPPPDPWARLRESAAARRWPPYRIPVDLLITFIDDYDEHRDGPAAADVLTKLRAALAT